MSDSGLLVNIAVALAVAFAGSYVAVRLRQSVIVGYIVAGVAIGPFTPGFVGDISSVQALADVGVIFLMFGIGAQLSLPDLLSVGRIALLGGLTQVAVMIAVGYAVGAALGWGWLESLFLGAVISNSSSTVLTKVLGERGEAGSLHARIALAWSSVQDTTTIVLIVALSALATSDQDLGPELAVALLKAGAFLAVMAVLGSRFLPILFDRVARYRNPEVFVGMVAAVALGTAYVSSFFGLSLALGAFVAGVVVAESDLSHQILGEVRPLRDIFAGLFFVAVGMLVDPRFIVENLPLVLIVLVLIVVVKGVVSSVIMRVAGYAAGTTVLTGVALAQSAEFSFLLARLGVDVGAVSSSAFSLMLSGAVLSIVLSPALHRLASPERIRALARVPLVGRRLEPADPGPEPPRLQRHTVICGFGRVGRELADALDKRRFAYLVVDIDPAVVRELRARGVPTLYGDASNPAVLEQAGLERATLLAVLMPDARAAVATTAYARRRHPRLDIVARAFNSEQVARLQRAGATEAVQPEFEAGIEVIHHAFHRYGVTGMELLNAISGRRRGFYGRDTREGP